MNFSPFGGHFSTSIPTIHQFAAKFSHEASSASTAATTTTSNNVLCQSENSSRYTANGIPSFTQHHPPTQQQHHQHNTTMVNNKYQNNYLNQTPVYHQNLRQPALEKRYEHQQQELTQDLCGLQSTEKHHEKNKHAVDNSNDRQPQLQQQMPSTWQSLATPGSTVADYLSHLPASTLPLSLHHFLKYSAESIKKETSNQHQQHDISLLANNSLSVNGNGSLLGAQALSSLTVNNPQQHQNSSTGTVTPSATNPKKKKKKKVEKEKKPRPKPGEIRLTTALDGSTLYCCPECHMAYPEKELLEQHLVGHTLERRFVCDICGAGLKRKDHLTRHKQSHNPERPYVCTVCLKAFKRKEQLTLHFVIHSGEKRHVCAECGKGFYRKDHLRKHTRSHIARRVKAELSQQGTTTTSSSSSSTSGLHLQASSSSGIL